MLAWPLQEGRTACLAALLTVPYVIGKVTGSGSLVENAAYRVSVSPVRFLKTFHLYLNPLSYRDHAFHDSNTVQILLLMLAFGIWRRSRSLLFAWSFLLLSILPAVFIGHYAAFFLYIPCAGWALYGAELLAAIRQAFSRRIGKLIRPINPDAPFARDETIVQAALFLAVACVLAPLHARENSRTLRHFLSVQPPAREMAAELLRVQPQLKRGAHVLFADDPFPRDQYFLLFLTRLPYHDMTIKVTRTRVQPCPVAQYRNYDVVLLYRRGNCFHGGRRTASDLRGVNISEPGGCARYDGAVHPRLIRRAAPGDISLYAVRSGYAPHVL